MSADRNIIKWMSFIALSALLGNVYAIGVGSLRYPLDEVRWFLFNLIVVVGVSFITVAIARKVVKQHKGELMLWWIVTLLAHIGAYMVFARKGLLEVSSEPASGIIVQAFSAIPVYCTVLVVAGVCLQVCCTRSIKSQGDIEK